jgi:phage terminase large subunit-like protein
VSEERADYNAELMAEEAALLQAEVELAEGLPHLYGFPWYEWAHDFFETRNRMAFLCAANQISKSSTQIRKCIYWATEKSLWPHLWNRPGLPPPNQFWYVMPTSQLATIEFETKWVHFLPKGKYKDDAKYGWKAEYKGKEILSIKFNSGVTVYFKSYKQGGFALQSATVYAIFLDEECPYDMWDEFVLRVSATDGYISMVFTATIGQEEWRQVIEPANAEEERYPTAWKRQVSVFDCMHYMDGSEGPWNLDRINDAIARCSSAAQVQRRIHGRFIKESGLIYEQFSPQRHMKPWHPTPVSWLWFVAADIGSGSTDSRGQGHPGGIVVVAVRPDFQVGRVVACWRGDGKRTTAGDIYNEAEKMIKELKIQPTAKLFDWGSADFGTIAQRNGGGWQPANKKHDEGEQSVNTLFKHDMLAIYQRGENGKLAGELCSLNHETPKRKRKDDLADPLRYICVFVPWDWRAIQGSSASGSEFEDKPKAKETPEQENARLRRGEMSDSEVQEREYEQEFDELNNLYEGR